MIVLKKQTKGDCPNGCSGIRIKSKSAFDSKANTYENTSDGKFCSRVYPEIIQIINSRQEDALLDVGCGTGTILSKLSGKGRLCGIDLSPQMIACAKQTLKDAAELKVGDAEALPWPDETFDTVCCTFSFHHYPNPEKVLSEMSRVLKKGGRLFMADPWMPLLLRLISNVFLKYSKDGDYHLYSRREMQCLLSKAGFTLGEFRHPTRDAFLLTANKAGGTERV